MTTSRAIKAATAGKANVSVAGSVSSRRPRSKGGRRATPVAASATDTKFETVRNDQQVDHAPEHDAAGDQDLSEVMKDFLKNNFTEILKELMNCLRDGNVSGAKVLLDYSKLNLAPGNEKRLKAADCFSILEVFGEGFDWSCNHELVEPALSVESEVGIDVGFGGREPE